MSVDYVTLHSIGHTCVPRGHIFSLGSSPSVFCNHVLAHYIGKRYGRPQIRLSISLHQPNLAYCIICWLIHLFSSRPSSGFTVSFHTSICCHSIPRLAFISTQSEPFSQQLGVLHPATSTPPFLSPPSTILLLAVMEVYQLGCTALRIGFFYRHLISASTPFHGILSLILRLGLSLIHR